MVMTGGAGRAGGAHRAARLPRSGRLSSRLHHDHHAAGPSAHRISGRESERSGIAPAIIMIDRQQLSRMGFYFVNFVLIKRSTEIHRRGPEKVAAGRGRPEAAGRDGGRPGRWRDGRA